jgi:transcriptional regulator with XRE-family HTH domain
MIKLKAIREAKDLLQKDIADILGVKQQAISKYENGTSKLNQDQIVKLCLELDITPDELLGFKEAYKKYTEYLCKLTEEKTKH